MPVIPSFELLLACRLNIWLCKWQFDKEIGLLAWEGIGSSAEYEWESIFAMKKFFCTMVDNIYV